MPASVAELHENLHDLFTGTARLLARLSGFCRRERQLTGPAFAQALVFGLLRHPDATRQDIADFARDRLGSACSPQALDQRLTAEAVAFLAGLLQAAPQIRFETARPALLPVLRRFDGVYLRDATLVPLPDGLIPVCPGRAGRAGQTAAVKVVAEVELATGLLTGLEALPGRSNEKAAGLAHAPLPAGSLLLEDMGFLAAERLQEYIAQGVYVLTRVPAWSAVFAPGGERIDLPLALEQAGGWYAEFEVELFHQRIPLRLLAARLPEEQAARRREKLRADAKKRGRAVSRDRLALCEWNVLLTNAPAESLSAREAWDVRRVRWQEELLFKGLKSGGGGLGRSRSSQPWRVACEV